MGASVVRRFFSWTLCRSQPYKDVPSRVFSSRSRAPSSFPCPGHPTLIGILLSLAREKGEKAGCKLFISWSDCTQEALLRLLQAN